MEILAQFRGRPDLGKAAGKTGLCIWQPTAGKKHASNSACFPVLEGTSFPRFLPIFHPRRLASFAIYRLLLHAPAPRPPLASLAATTATACSSGTCCRDGLLLLLNLTWQRHSPPPQLAAATATSFSSISLAAATASCSFSFIRSTEL